MSSVMIYTTEDGLTKIDLRLDNGTVWLSQAQIAEFFKDSVINVTNTGDDNMAFDIYAGGFSRFYARQWDNEAQAHAKETGTHYQMIYAGDDPGPADWDEIQEAVQDWRGAIINGLREHVPSDLMWSEEKSAPYFTDRPGWDAYSALIVMAACTACNEALPARLDEDALSSDLVMRTYDPQMRNAFRSITKTQIWLPGSFEFSFDFVDLGNEPVHVGSVKALNADLASICLKQGITPQDLESALQEGYADDADLKTLATFGLAVFTHIASKAQQNQLPILLSF